MTSSYAFATLDDVQNIIKEHGKQLSNYGVPQPNLPYHETLMEVVEGWSHDTTTLTGKSTPNALAWHVTKNATGHSSIAREEVVTLPWNNMGICCLIVSQDEPHTQPLSPCSDVH